MSGHRENDEILAETIERMGEDLGQEMHYLEATFTRLRGDWQQYRSLYGTDADRLALLDRAAGYFFARLQSILWETVLLAIARLIDDNKEVVSIRRMIHLIPDKCLKAELMSTMTEVSRSCSFAKGWRDKHIAHSNRQIALRSAALPEASRHHVEVALNSIGNLLNKIALAHGSFATAWEDVITPPTDANCLLHVLSDGIRSEEAQRNRILNGTYTSEDVTADHGLWKPDIH